jgi:hypothetical protein
MLFSTAVNVQPEIKFSVVLRFYERQMVPLYGFNHMHKTIGTNNLVPTLFFWNWETCSSNLMTTVEQDVVGAVNCLKCDSGHAL